MIPPVEFGLNRSRRPRFAPLRTGCGLLAASLQLGDPGFHELADESGRQRLVRRESNRALRGFILLQVGCMRAHDCRAHRIEAAMICRRPVTDQRTSVQPECREAVAEALFRTRGRGVNSHPDFLQCRRLIGRNGSEVGIDVGWPLPLGLNARRRRLSHTVPSRDSDGPHQLSRPSRIIRSTKPRDAAPEKRLDNQARDESQPSRPRFVGDRQHGREGGTHEKSSPMDCHGPLTSLSTSPPVRPRRWAAARRRADPHLSLPSSVLPTHSSGSRSGRPVQARRRDCAARADR